MRRELAAAVALAAVFGSAEAQSTVTTTYGTLLGTTSPFNNNVRTFLGIPYAAPPVGDLRWASPVTPAPWTGVRNATAFANACMQNLTPGGSASGTDGAPSESEDCLFLNVWTPCPANNCSLPVLFWIHGGYLTVGNSAEPVFNGTPLASQNAVFVSLNYRLDVLGFLYTGQPGGANWGFQDQQLALKWVQANIAQFGGDPSRVMIFGESAGAFSVSAQLMMPSSNGLFRRAALQSGVLAFYPNTQTLLPYLLKANEALMLQSFLLQQLGCSPGNITCARTHPINHILMITQRMSMPTATNPFGLIFAAVRDGVVLPTDTVAALRSGSGMNSNVDIIAGYNTNEGSLFVNDPSVYRPELFRLLLNQLHGGGCAAAQSFLLYSPGNITYPGSQSTYSTILPAQLKSYQAWARDFIFKCPARNLAQSAYATVNTSNPRNVYLYEFAMEPTFGPYAAFSLGATHGADIGYVMGTGMPFFTTNDERALSGLMMSSWINFAATGSPGSFWPPFDPVNQTMVVFGPGNATTVTVPHGQNVMLTSFPTNGCTYLDPGATTPACLERPSMVNANLTSAAPPAMRTSALATMPAVLLSSALVTCGFFFVARPL